ncbi:sensor histidine kinase [Crocinitomix algicola]|uniref:sensor histidine kinase n=1 Tax=Crocinitomix algicola TaxID=1740263 RepID=UPI0008731370|nr:HAMP domain-containing sensor histidine kinase [Crocinitomix algicola]
MLKKRFKNPIFLIYVLVGYVTVQFCWWLYLIFRLYNQMYSNPETLSNKVWMLLGEGIVFFLIMVFGILTILRAFRYERKLIKQQENFILSITHELKTPISSVKLALQTLMKRKLSQTQTDKMYEQSLQEINRLNGLVNNLLLTRSIENKNYYLEKKEVNLKIFIEQLIPNFQNTFLKNHKITLQLADVNYKIDKIAFQSILANLIENATKYSPQDTEITVNLINNPEHIIIEVLDEGIGIKKEIKPIVFRKFYRDENEMTRKSKGTGLGLYITRYLVYQHNGIITLEDNSPNGLKVKIQLRK